MSFVISHFTAYAKFTDDLTFNLPCVKGDGLLPPRKLTKTKQLSAVIKLKSR